MSTDKQYDKSKSKDITSALKIIFWLLLTLATIIFLILKEIGIWKLSWWIVFAPIGVPFAFAIIFIVVAIIGGALISFLFPPKKPK